MVTRDADDGESTVKNGIINDPPDKDPDEETTVTNNITIINVSSLHRLPVDYVNVYLLTVGANPFTGVDTLTTFSVRDSDSGASPESSAGNLEEWDQCDVNTSGFCDDCGMNPCEWLEHGNDIITASNELFPKPRRSKRRNTKAVNTEKVDN